MIFFSQRHIYLFLYIALCLLSFETGYFVTASANFSSSKKLTFFTFLFLMVFPWNYKVRRNVNSGFPIATMRRVAILYFWIRNCKKIHAKILSARHFMIIFLFKNCPWLQQFYILIESFKYKIFYKVLFENQHVDRLVSSVSNSCNICEPYLLHSNTRIQVWDHHTKPMLRKIWWEPFCFKVISV